MQWPTRASPIPGTSSRIRRPRRRKRLELFQHTYIASAKGATDYNLKVFEFARANTNAAFEYVHELFGVKSPFQFVELSSSHARKHFETMTAQAKELNAVAQSVSIEATKPLKAEFTAALDKAA